jgi:hypothetical protein
MTYNKNMKNRYERLIKMTGSEKQIAWAQGLEKEIVKCIDAVIDGNRNHPMYAQYKAQADEVISTWEYRKSSLLACNSAPAIIDFFGQFNATGNINKDAASVNAIYTTTLNNGYKFK